ncbi:ATP-dependent DNA helicase recQ [Thozetella sp. PMI_491]|nr:ATP-dependent DNA helicase recQ [Thozetella sp. PMI_491]
MADDDYGSGDDLFGDVDPDQLIDEEKSAGHKRQHSLDYNDAKTQTAKKARLEDAGSVHMTLARKLLHDTFGYDSFRHEQEMAIAAILRGENGLVIFPTGAGKSLCYQIPAIAFEELDAQLGSSRKEGPGITIVVSPLIALMKDQTDSLKQRGIAAESSDSTKTWEQQQEVARQMQAGKLRLLYCAPERLNNEGFVQQMKHVPGGVRLIAVDEAHCISEWGHSFRPDYLKVARFVDEVQAETVICLTATATPRVAEDVRQAFNISTDNVYRTSPYRPNLQLEAESTSSKEDKFPKLSSFLKKHPGATLVYVTLQQQAERLAKDLVKQGFDAAAFHAGMKPEEKSKIQDDFMASKIRIVVATIAFGMGIDKSDIRNVVHWDLANSVEEYSQQVGRAGRDGLPSSCMLYICNEDFYLKENFARGDLPSLKSLQDLLKDVFHQETTHEFGADILKLSTYSLSRTYDIRPSPLSIIFATLELTFGLLRAITPEYTTYQWEDRGGFYARAPKDPSETAKAIWQNARKASKLYHFDIKAATSKTGIPRGDLIRKLDRWHNEGMILLKTSGVQQRYRLLKPLPQTAAEIDEIAGKLHKTMVDQEAEALLRTRQLSDMMTASKCFALSLAEHFGMGLPDGKASCGHCTFCATKTPVVLPAKEMLAVDLDGVKKVLDACPVRDDPRFLARIAFGIKSPRVTQMKLDRHAAFGSLAQHAFSPLLREFEKACAAENTEL